LKTLVAHTIDIRSIDDAGLTDEQLEARRNARDLPPRI
jgi:hypothetical protein